MKCPTFTTLPPLAVPWLVFVLLFTAAPHSVTATRANATHHHAHHQHHRNSSLASVSPDSPPVITVPAVETFAAVTRTRHHPRTDKGPGADDDTVRSEHLLAQWQTNSNNNSSTPPIPPVAASTATDKGPGADDDAVRSDAILAQLAQHSVPPPATTDTTTESSNASLSTISIYEDDIASTVTDDEPWDDAVQDDATDDPAAPDRLVMRHFVAHNRTMTCTADEHSLPFNNQIRGVNLGGWMVLEPWITPSLFLQFLGKGINETAFDQYSFCQVLGPSQANEQLRRHWDTWLNLTHIQQLASSGAVNSLRLPVGDFLFVPYGPYRTNCLEGALERVDQLLDWAYSYGMSVLIDIHTMKDSQNGFDNSGQSMGFAWTSQLSSDFAGLTTFEHWPIRTANWIGDFDPKTASYTSINYGNIQHALSVIRAIVDRYAGHPAVLGLEPLNEPWQYTPIRVLQRFYWEGYLIVKEKAPYWKYIMHDSFRFSPRIWGGFMKGCPDRALDTHIYQAWHDPDSRLSFYADACRQKRKIATMERAFGPVIVGEWSLATDNCAMWLNGFNDNLPGFPRLPCKYTPCSDPYMGTEQPGTPVDPSKALQGPYGTGMSGPIFGLCPGSRDWLKEQNGPITGRDWITAPANVPPRFDDTNEVMSRLAAKKIDAFSGVGHGFYFWNFRTDLYEPQWSYMAALERGWIPRGNLQDDKIRTACQAEDLGEFKCILKHGQLDRAVRKAVAYCYRAQNMSDSTEAQAMLNMSDGPQFQKAAEKVLSDYFESYRLSGATCDFGGVAMLVEENRTVTWNKKDIDSDSYFEYIVYRGPPIWLIVIGALFLAALSAVIGFVCAMRASPSFNRRIRSSTLFRPLVQSQNNLLRQSLSLPMLDDYGELQRLVQKQQAK